MRRPAIGCLSCAAALLALAQVACGASDLLLLATDSEDPTRVGHTFSYMISVTNVGPDAVTNAQITDVLPEQVSFVDCSVSQGSWTEEFGVVTCDLGEMGAGATAEVQIVVQATEVGADLNRRVTRCCGAPARPSRRGS